MTKKDLIQAIALEANLTKTKAKLVVEGVFDHMTTALLAGKPVSIVGFGRFEIKKRKARRGRNPNTGEDMQLPDSQRLNFVPSKGLNQQIKKKGA